MNRASLPVTRNERLRVILGNIQGTEILHVGCVDHQLPRSSAEMADHLHFQLWRQFPERRLLGLDIDASQIEDLRHFGFDAIEGDAEEMDFVERFDTIVAGEIIEHLSSPGRFLKGCRRALKQGGRLILSTPNPYSIMYFLMYAKNFDRAFNMQHSCWFCPQTLRELLSRSGFEIEKLSLLDDLRPGLVNSPVYKAFSYSWKFARPLFPKRFRNTLLVVARRPVGND
ncbi:MAG: methyltransferase domain-containing protein [Candidatus Korobacteraceae bacterium]